MLMEFNGHFFVFFFLSLEKSTIFFGIILLIFAGINFLSKTYFVTLFWDFDV